MARSRRAPDPPFPRPTTVVPHELGRGRIEQGLPDGRPQKVLRIDATGVSSTLLGRLVVGSYITGQDQVLVTARGGLAPGQRTEIHRVVGRLLGMSVVDDRPEAVEIENFVDPGKYELPRLLGRVVELIRRQLEICLAAVVGDSSARLDRLDAVEEEIDQLYLLMVRQLLLSSDSPRLAHEIDVESHHFQLGDRLIAKVLEVTGDLVHNIGTDLRDHLDGVRQMPPALTRAIAHRLRRLTGLLDRTMTAFANLSVPEANATLNRIAEVLPRDAYLGPMIARRVPDPKVAGAIQRVVCHLVMAHEMLVVVNEVTINRSVEPETVALTGTRVTLGGRSGASLPRVARPVVLASPAVPVPDPDD